MRFPLAAIALAVLSASAAPQQPSSSVIALTNVIVIDGTGAAPVSGMTVLIDGPRIADVFPTGTKPLPPGAAVRDLSGHTVIPGLIDAHVHLVPLLASGRADAELRRMLRAGIVAVREMAGAQVTQAIRERIGAGELDGPDVYSSFVMAGPQFMALDPRVAGRGRAGGGEAGRGRGAAPGAGMTAGTVSSEADVPVVTMRAVDSGASAVKFYAELSPSLMSSLSAAARARGLKVWAHPTMYPTRPMETVRAGVDGLSHACGFVWQDPDLDPSPYASVNLNARPRFDPALVDADGPEMTALLREMAGRGIVFDPTLANHARPGDDEFGCTTAVAVAIAKAAKRAGVALLAGTDFHAPADAPYPSLYQEIELLVSSGVLTPIEALAAATSNAARAMGLGSSGTIAPGQDASLVVLRADPSKDIRAIREVVTVFKRGREVE